MLMMHTRALLIVALVLALGAAYRFYRRQNTQRGSGGRISLPKIAWLFYAVFVWFLLCPLLALDPAVPQACRWIFGAFAASMWIRGAAEMYMLYVSKNWRPPYGIAHDLLCLGIIGALAVSFRAEVAITLPAILFWGFVAVVVASLVVEVLYAALFFQAVHGRTMGEDGIWFADDEDAKFRRINRITATLNVPLYASTIAFLGGCLWWPAA
jgi:hypothetical protein